MRVTPHLCFDGECEAAFRFYERILGGRIQTMLTYGKSPAAEQTPIAFRNRIIHATLDLGGYAVTGVDLMPEHYARPTGFFVLLSFGDVERARTIFAALAEQGQVHMPFAETFWSPGFGVVVDRFGIPWEIDCEAPTSAHHTSG